MTFNEDLELMKQPFAPFMVWAWLHLTIATGQLRRYFDGEVDGLFTWPIILCAFGGIWDNIRLYRGSRYGQAGVCTSVTNVRYLFRMAAVPMLFIPISDLIGQLTTLTFLGIAGKIASVAFVVHGFNEFVIQVAGNYVTVSEYGITRHTVEPKMRNASIRIPTVIVAAGGIVLGLAAMKTHEATFTLLLQVFCVMGRFAAPVYPQYAVALSRGLEALFLFTVVHIQRMIY